MSRERDPQPEPICEIPMPKLEALRMIAVHYGYSGIRSNTFMGLLMSSDDDDAEFTIGCIQRLIGEERKLSIVHTHSDMAGRQ